MAGLSESPGFGGGGDASVDTRFDASQYAFFGKDVVEEVELGGLEDEECDNAGSVGLDDESYQFSAFGDKEESNKVVSEGGRLGVTGDRGYFSREGSAAANWAHEPDFSNWPNQHILDTEAAQDDRRRWSQPHPSEAHLADSKSLYRTSSIPQQQHQHISSKPLQVHPPAPTNQYYQYRQYFHPHSLVTPLGQCNQTQCRCNIPPSCLHICYSRS